VFLDPPYDATEVTEVFERLVSGGFIEPATTVVYEHSRRTEPPAECGMLRQVVTRVHGTTAITLYQSEESDIGTVEGA
jgi:16S rRNA G966 N2-methylase RsmD